MRGILRDTLRQLTRAGRPLALRSAGKAGSHNSVICHVGRRSGRTYQTPVVAVAHDDGFLIALPYAERTDWLKNVLAARSAKLITGGQTYDVDDPAVIPMSEAAEHFPPKERRLQKRLGVESALRLHRR